MKYGIAAIAASTLLACGTHAADINTTRNVYTGEPQKEYFVGAAGGFVAGGQFNSIEIDNDKFNFDGVASDGLVGGVALEYLMKLGRQTRVGPYAECGLGNVKTTLDTHWGDAEISQDYWCGAGLKAGVVVYDYTLVFARVGYEHSEYTAKADGSDVDASANTLLVGGGVDTMISDNVSLGVGVDYLNAGSIEFDGDDKVDFDLDGEGLRGTARLIYRF